MLDPFGRKIEYLRISVTDRCNLRCIYCMPAEGITLLSHDDILTFDEIVETTRIAVKLGVRKVRITGGEPLVRKGIIDLVARIASIKGIEDLSMTSNGVLLAQYASGLKKAGLHRINISLDTTDKEHYHQITRTGDVAEVIQGIKAAVEAGLLPVKINCVINNSPDEPDARGVSIFCKNNNLEIRYIYQMNLAKGEFNGVIGGDGGKCETCNRLRLSSNGDIMPCLFSDLSFNIRKLGIYEAIIQAVNHKPLCGKANHTSHFYSVGG